MQSSLVKSPLRFQETDIIDAIKKTLFKARPVTYLPKTYLTFI